MHMHVILPDVPYPSKSGIEEDRFFRLQALAAQGVGLHLHAFTTGRVEIAPELYDLSEDMLLYPIRRGILPLSNRYPKEIQLRQHPDLIRNLLGDDLPILFEGLESTYYLSHPDIESRIKAVRLPRIEWEYLEFVHQLQNQGRMTAAQAREVQRWQQFEQTLSYATHLMPMSPVDAKSYANWHESVTYLPPFHGHSRVSIKPGSGKYWLFYGDLGEPENHAAAIFLLKEIFGTLKRNLIIAGRKPQAELISMVSHMDHVTLFYDPGQGQLTDLIRDAHGLVLPAFRDGGPHMSLIHGLFMGRFVVVSPQMVEGTGLGFGVSVAQDPAAMQRMVFDLGYQEFSDIDLAQRQAVIKGRLDDAQNATRLLEIIRQG